MLLVLIWVVAGFVVISHIFGAISDGGSLPAVIDLRSKEEREEDDC